MQTEFIKFRATPAQKARLEAVAEENDTSVSALLRLAANHLAAGRPVVKNVATDFATIRRMANAALETLSPASGSADPESLEQLRISMSALKDLAGRYLDGTRC
jgi:hypothetical protein